MLGFSCTSKTLRENYTWTTAISGKNENCRTWPNVCTEFLLTLRGDTLDFLSSQHKNVTARNSDKAVLKLLRGKESTDVSSAGCHGSGVTSCILKHKDLGTRNYV